ncbi:unnamed protein product [Darwinula stevensoni]|uniref:Cyclin-dependent kinase inhibitor domain-containing protein n=1 Tax=Darwinula stevensoni TaxID=69355 RepID=A0A7R9A577_9CRUS|nr:unnamed protein product [Darwinula stevensoni]CAG0885847.1 unnamed protein product [Darwinula stevensoni]
MESCVMCPLMDLRRVLFPRSPDGVSRELFPADDGEKDVSGSKRELLRRLDQDLQDIREMEKRKWNFDFETMTPLPGRYKWVPVRSSSPEGSRTEFVFNGPPLDHDDGNSDKSEKSGENSHAGSRRRREKSLQTSITDFMHPKRKRQRLFKADESPPTSTKEGTTT